MFNTFTLMQKKQGMELIKKKIIAREFLILIACAMVFGLAFISIIPYNYLIESRIEKLEDASQFKSDSIKKIQQGYSRKISNQTAFFDKCEIGNWFTVGKNYIELWSKLEKARADGLIKKNWDGLSADFKNDLKDKCGFNSSLDFENFLIRNSLTENEMNINVVALKLIDEMEIIESKVSLEKLNLLNFSDQLEFSFICLAVMGILSFPMRYIFYAIKWSFTTLKQKEQ